MNKTKKLTQGAMLLAIIGALMIIDRQLSYFFGTLILLFIPVVIAIYGVMYDTKDALVMCVGLLVLGILFGSLTTYIYMPISIIVGICVCMCIKKGFDRRRINIIASIVYVVAEIIVAFVVSPLVGISVKSQIDSMREMIDQMSTAYGMNISSLVSNLSTLLLVCLIASTILMGILEGYLTGLFTTFMLKRFKIKDIGINSPLDIKMPVWLAYVLMLLSLCSMFILKIPGLESSHPAIVYTLMCVSGISTLVLAYYGYLFIIIYTNIRYGRKNIMLILLACILLFPLSYIILIVVGFLYGSGPLRNYLEKYLKK